MGNLVTSMVEFAANGGTAPGYLTRPEGEGPFPGVVVIQEWWGLNDQIKGVADRLALEGFGAIAPDLYRGKVTAEPDEARKLVMMLDRAQAAKDIQGAVNYLVSQPWVEPKKVGVMGFCMGGALAATIAHAGKNVGAVAIYYGSIGEPDDKVAEAITAPILGLYGEADHGIPVDQVKEWQSLLEQHGKTNDMVIYPGAPHQFFNEERPSYRPEAAEDAWNRTLAWWRQHLTSA